MCISLRHIRLVARMPRADRCTLNHRISFLWADGTLVRLRISITNVILSPSLPRSLARSLSPPALSLSVSLSLSLALLLALSRSLALLLAFSLSLCSQEQAVPMHIANDDRALFLQGCWQSDMPWSLQGRECVRRQKVCADHHIQCCVLEEKMFHS